MIRNHLGSNGYGQFLTVGRVAYLTGLFVRVAAVMCGLAMCLPAQTREATEGGVSGAAKVTHHIHWKRIAVKTAVLAGASVLQYKATTYCSRGDVEQCIEKYGSRRAFNWFSIGMGAALIPLSEKCSNEDGPKPACYGFGYGVPAMQTAFGIHDYLSFQPKPKGESDEKVNLRSFAVVSRPF